LSQLTHFNPEGRGRMVDVSAKEDTRRRAVATARVVMKPETLELICNRRLAKGDVLGVAQVAGIMAAKETGRLIPMCHPLMLTGVDLSFDFQPELSSVLIRAEVKTTGKTGVEMEALTAVSVAALTVYDMCKAVDREMTITDIRLELKQGGKSGLFHRDKL